MIKELLDVFRREDPDDLLTSRLSRMLKLAQKLVLESGKRLFDGPVSERDRDAFYETDRQINALEQDIRESLVARLELSTATERARFLLIIGLVKDVERLGDYAKNLLETAEMCAQPLPEKVPQVAKLRELRDEVEASFERARLALLSSEPDEAQDLIAQGHALGKRCEELIRDIANSELHASTAVPLALAARHYKRIQKHLMNALTTLTRPLHKVGYYE